MVTLMDMDILMEMLNWIVKVDSNRLEKCIKKIFKFIRFLLV